jgi:ribosomal protein L9
MGEEMTETTLFNYQTKTLCHKNDSDTSRLAAQKAAKKLTEKQMVVLRRIRNYCRNHIDFTPKEVAGGINRMYFDIQRRKNELAVKGKIKKTGSERGGCEVWRLAC